MNNNTRLFFIYQAIKVKIMSFKELGTATNVDELRKLLEPYPGFISFGFCNQPMQALFERKIGEETFVVFQESPGSRLEYTDLKKFIDIYKLFGVELRPFEEEGVIKIHLGQSSSVYAADGLEQFEGHSGFFSEIQFDQEGKFIKQGFWE